jgi:hypothetical protein
VHLDDFPRSAGFQTCDIADFQIGKAAKRQGFQAIQAVADSEIRDTADLEVGATGMCPNARANL